MIEDDCSKASRRQKETYEYMLREFERRVLQVTLVHQKREFNRSPLLSDFNHFLKREEQYVYVDCQVAPYRAAIQRQYTVVNNNQTAPIDNMILEKNSDGRLVFVPAENTKFINGKLIKRDFVDEAKLSGSAQNPRGSSVSGIDRQRESLPLV